MIFWLCCKVMLGIYYDFLALLYSDARHLLGYCASRAIMSAGASLANRVVSSSSNAHFRTFASIS